MSSQHKDYKGSSHNITIEWENGELTDKPLFIITKDDSVSCAFYAKENNLLELPGRKRFKNIARTQKIMFREANFAKLHSFSTAPKFKYSYEIPRNYKHAMKLDKRNGKTKWADATKLEMELMHSCNVFEDKRIGT